MEAQFGRVTLMRSSAPPRPSSISDVAGRGRLDDTDRTMPERATSEFVGRQAEQSFDPVSGEFLADGELRLHLASSSIARWDFLGLG
jgi:hypothetical protein